MGSENIAKTFWNCNSSFESLSPATSREILRWRPGITVGSYPSFSSQRYGKLSLRHLIKTITYKWQQGMLNCLLLSSLLMTATAAIWAIVTQHGNRSRREGRTHTSTAVTLQIARISIRVFVQKNVDQRTTLTGFTAELAYENCTNESKCCVN